MYNDAVMANSPLRAPLVEVRSIRLRHAQHGGLQWREIRLLSRNGYRRVLRTQWLWSVPGQPHRFSSRDVELTSSAAAEFPLRGIAGHNESAGAALRWDLSWSADAAARQSWLPNSFGKILGMGLGQPARVERVFHGVPVQGMFQWGEERLDWSGALAHGSWSVGHWALPRWSWLYAPRLAREGDAGDAARLTLEAYCTPLALGFAATSFAAEFEGRLHTGRALSRTQVFKGAAWDFVFESQTERGLVFKGSTGVPQKEVASLPLEDAGGNIAYSSSSLLASSSVTVYRSGKLEATYSNSGDSCLELVSRTANPYVRPLA